MKKIRKFVIENRILIAVLSALLLVGIFCWQVWESSREFGLNFTTEILGVIVTVFVIDQLIKQQEKRNSIPLKLAAYEDVRLFMTRYLMFWLELYRATVPEDDPETLEDFFSPKGMEKIWHHLHIEAEIGNPAPKKMWEYLSEVASEFKVKSDQILERHVSTLDPSAYKLLHQLSESWCIAGLMKLPKSYQALVGYPTISILASYCMMPTLLEDYEPAIGLIRWCEEIKPELLKFDLQVRDVYPYTSFKRSNDLPRS